MNKDKHKLNNWENTTERFVAFFDIMGFKDMVMRNNHETIISIFNELSIQRKMLHNSNNIKIESSEPEKSKSFETGETISFTFSDSIIFFSKSNSTLDYRKILMDSMFLLYECLKAGIPIKGALSYGKITVDKDNSIYFGQPIIDAYLLNEELQMYAVIIDHIFEMKAKELSGTKFKNGFIEYRTPLKSGKATHCLLKPFVKDTYITSLKGLYQKASGKPRQYIDNSIDFINVVSSIELKDDSTETF